MCVSIYLNSKLDFIKDSFTLFYQSQIQFVMTQIVLMLKVEIVLTVVWIAGNWRFIVLRCRYYIRVRTFVLWLFMQLVNSKGIFSKTLLSIKPWPVRVCKSKFTA